MQACKHSFIYYGNLGSVNQKLIYRICLENKSKTENFCISHDCTSICGVFCSHNLMEVKFHYENTELDLINALKL